MFSPVPAKMVDASGSRSRLPLDSLTVLLTSGCNLECQYCFRQAGSSRDLAWRDLERALVWAAATPGEELEVIFSGGEPLLAFETLRKAVKHIRHPACEGRAVEIRVLTNGLLLEDERLDFLVRHSVFVDLSFDGVPESQAARGAGTWAALDLLIGRIADRYPDWSADHLKVTVTLTPANLHNLADSVTYLVDRGVGGVGISPALSRVPGWDDDRWQDLDRQLGLVSELAQQHLAETGRVPFIPFRKYREMGPPRPKDRNPCVALEGRNPVLDVDGRLTSCMMFAPSGLDSKRPRRAEISRDLGLGRIDDRDFEKRRNGFHEDVRNRDIFRSAPELSSRYRSCSECPAADFCRICPLTLLEFGKGDSPTKVPALLCAYNYLMVEYHRKFPVQDNPTPPRVTVESLRSRMRYWDEVHAKNPGS